MENVYETHKIPQVEENDSVLRVQYLGKVARRRQLERLSETSAFLAHWL